MNGITGLVSVIIPTYNRSNLSKNETILPEYMIRQRLSGAYCWLGQEEFHQNRSSSRKHLWQSLLLSPFQKKVAAYFMLTFIPRLGIDLLKTFKHTIKKGS